MLSRVPLLNVPKNIKTSKGPWVLFHLQILLTFLPFYIICCPNTVETIQTIFDWYLTPKIVLLSPLPYDLKQSETVQTDWYLPPKINTQVPWNLSHLQPVHISNLLLPNVSKCVHHPNSISSHLQMFLRLILHYLRTSNRKNCPNHSRSVSPTKPKRRPTSLCPVCVQNPIPELVEAAKEVTPSGQVTGQGGGREDSGRRWKDAATKGETKTRDPFHPASHGSRKRKDQDSHRPRWWEIFFGGLVWMDIPFRSLIVRSQYLFQELKLRIQKCKSLENNTDWLRNVFGRVYFLCFFFMNWLPIPTFRSPLFVFVGSKQFPI